MVQVSVVRSNSAQRSIVDSVNVRNSLDGDSQHRRTSSFPENMTAGKYIQAFVTVIDINVWGVKDTVKQYAAGLQASASMARSSAAAVPSLTAEGRSGLWVIESNIKVT